MKELRIPKLNIMYLVKIIWVYHRKKFGIIIMYYFSRQSNISYHFIDLKDILKRVSPLVVKKSVNMK